MEELAKAKHKNSQREWVRNAPPLFAGDDKTATISGLREGVANCLGSAAGKTWRQERDRLILSGSDDDTALVLGPVGAVLDE